MGEIQQVIILSRKDCFAIQEILTVTAVSPDVSLDFHNVCKGGIWFFFFFAIFWTTVSMGKGANRFTEPMYSTNPKRPDHNHRENPLLFSNSDVGSLTSPTKP